MTYSHTQFQIQELRARNQQKVLESILVLLAALFISALLPSLLLRYFYDTAQLLEQPRALEYIPVVSFVVGIGYLLFALIGNMMREKKISQLQSELATMSHDCNCGHAHDDAISSDELAELERMVDEVLDTKEAEEKTAKKSSKATKSAKKKSASKSKSSKKSK